MKAYKFTDENNKTRGNILWGENVTHSVEDIQSQDLRSSLWTLFYCNPLIAVLMNPIYDGFKQPILWECEAHEPLKHESLRSGCLSLTTIRKIDLPVITLTQKIAFAILCSLEVYGEVNYVLWANNWLQNIDRSKNTAHSIITAAKATEVEVAHAAAHAVAYDATYAVAYTASCAASINKNIDFVALAEKAMTY